MKKIIITLSFVVAMMLNVVAQESGVHSYDGFFSSTESSGNRGSGSVLSTPSIPGMGEFEDQDGDGDELPLGSGLLILAGMGLAYGLRKSKRQ